MAKCEICAGEICFPVNQEIRRLPITPHETISLVNSTEMGRAIWSQMASIPGAQVDGGYKIEIALSKNTGRRKAVYLVEQGVNDTGDVLCLYTSTRDGLVCALIRYSPGDVGRLWENARACAPTRYTPKPLEKSRVFSGVSQEQVLIPTVAIAGSVLEDILVGAVFSSVPALFPGLPPLSSAIAFAGLSFVIVGTAYYLGGKLARRLKGEHSAEYFTVFFSGPAKEVLGNIVGVGVGGKSLGGNLLVAGILYDAKSNFEAIGIKRDSQGKMAVVSGNTEENGKKIMQKFSRVTGVPVLVAHGERVTLFTGDAVRDVCDNNCFCFAVATKETPIPEFVPRVSHKTLANIASELGSTDIV